MKLEQQEVPQVVMPGISVSTAVQIEADLDGIRRARSFTNLRSRYVIACNFIEKQCRDLPPASIDTYLSAVLLAYKSGYDNLIAIGEIDGKSQDAEGQKDQIESTRHPPRALEGFLCLLTPREKQNEVAGQLTEMYGEWSEKYGERYAKVLYCKESCRSLYPIAKHGVRWLIRYRVLHYLWEFIGRFSQH